MQNSWWVFPLWRDWYLQLTAFILLLVFGTGNTFSEAKVGVCMAFRAILLFKPHVVYMLLFWPLLLKGMESLAGY